MNLNVAADRHKHKVLNELLDAGAVPDAGTLCTLVLYRSKSENFQKKNFETIRRILGMGVDPNELPYKGHAPAVDLAAHSPNLNVLRLLIESGAIPTADSTVHCAIANDHHNNLRLLIDSGVDMQTPLKNRNPNDDFTPTPLEYAELLKSRKCLELLRAVLP